MFILLLASSLPAAEVPSSPALLHPGQAVTLRIRQVLPADGLSPGERLLNSRSPIQAGDHFLAEIIEPPCPRPALIGGTVTKVVSPGFFGRPGYVTLELSQWVRTVDGQASFTPWQIDLYDRRLSAHLRRTLLSALLSLEGAVVGASFGAQLASGNEMAWLGGSAGVGLLLGAAYASLQRGVEARLEPGDTFRVVVGSLSYKPAPRDWQTVLYPAADPAAKRAKSQRQP